MNLSNLRNLQVFFLNSTFDFKPPRKRRAKRSAPPCNVLDDNGTIPDSNKVTNLRFGLTMIDRIPYRGGLDQIGLECSVKSSALVAGSLSSWKWRWWYQTILILNTVDKVSCTGGLWTRHRHFRTIRKFALTGGTLLIAVLGLVHFPTAKFAGDISSSTLGRRECYSSYCVLNACDFL